MKSNEHFVESCIPIKESGVRLGDKMCISPFQGNKRTIVVKRTEYEFITATVNKIVQKESTKFTLPSLSTKVRHLKLIFVSPDSDGEEGRYFVKSLDNYPFKINGVWAQRGLPCARKHFGVC